MEPAGRNVSGPGMGLELRTRKPSLFLPWMCLLNFSLSPDCSLSHGRMRLPKLQVLHVVSKPMSRNCFSGPIPNYLETGNLIHLGSSDWPWSNQLGTEEVEGRERGGHTAQPQLNPGVNRGHRARRKLKHTPLRYGQNGPPKRQKS